MAAFNLTPHRWAVLAILAMIGALRLAELIFSFWRLQQDRQSGATPIVEPLFPWMVAVHFAWYAGCGIEAWFLPRQLETWLLWVCSVLWVASLLLRGWLWSSLGRLWSVRLVAREHQTVVVTGPYAWVRHPNYLAVVLEIATVPIILGAGWTALLGSFANAFVVGLRIRREERYLFSRPGYRDAFERKKRIEGMAGLLSCEALLRLSDGTDETLRLALRVLKERLGADVGFVHRFERGRYTPVTRHALGGDTETRIGCPILPTDVLAHVARRGRLAIGDVHTHHAFRIAASRLGGRAGEVVSVAMLPLTTRAGVVAMIELGRMDHSFRTGDARALRAVAGVATSRLS